MSGKTPLSVDTFEKVTIKNPALELWPLQNMSKKLLDFVWIFKAASSYWYFKAKYLVHFCVSLKSTHVLIVILPWDPPRWNVMSKYIYPSAIQATRKSYRYANHTYHLFIYLFIRFHMCYEYINTIMKCMHRSPYLDTTGDFTQCYLIWKIEVNL